MLQDTVLAVVFWNSISEIQSIKAKIGKYEYIKLKGFSTTKEIISRMKRTSIDKDTIFANYTSYKWVVSKICK